MTGRIPRELQELNQWVVADMSLNAHGEPSKAPLTPSNGKFAAVDDSTTWGTFEAAKQTGQPVGFVLSKSDPYTIIDLDDPFKRTDRTRIVEGDEDYPDALARVQRHAKILQLFDSYTEISQSGQGMHIIVRGTIPAGRRKDKVEVYSSERYMICTGNVYHDAPITDRQELLDILYAEMTTTAFVEQLDDHEATLSDEDVVRMAMSASNADKFNKLCRGEWETLTKADGQPYGSQSEADLALMTILAYYTRDNQQAIRLFRYSELGKRDKALRDDYFIGSYGMLNKIRGQQPPLIDMTQLQLPQQLAEEPAPAPAPQLPTPKQAPDGELLPFPPGLVGEIAEFHMRYNVRPMREAALAAGIALTAGIIGRSYNISNTGLNQYVIVLATTGRGKEGMSQTIDALINRIRHTVPAADMFVGPGEFGSGQGIVRTLDDHPCFVSVLGEFGITLQQVSRHNASNAEIAIEKMLLKLYSQSGFHQTLKSTAYSKKENNTKMVQAPNVTLLCESTPEKFFAGLSEDQVASGLIPRFLTLQYSGARPAPNKNAFGAPPDSLVHKLVDLATIAVTTQQNNTCAHVQQDSDGRRLLDAFEVRCDSDMADSNEAVIQIWNRAHLKALKLAALVAVGCNPHAPVITGAIAEWTIEVILQDVTAMLNKFAAGEVGRGHTYQQTLITKMMQQYLDMPVAKRRNYKAPESVRNVQVVPMSFFAMRVRNVKAFEVPNKTPQQVVDQILKEMVDLEIIDRMPLDQTLAKFQTRVALFSPGVNWSIIPQ
jgi:hypothetical protein